MNTALLLIALGFGFKLFAEAGKPGEKSFKRLGRFVGGFMMIVAFAGVVFTLWNKCYQGTLACPMPFPNAGSSGSYSAPANSGMKTMCPFMGKAQGQDGEDASSGTPVAAPSPS